MILQSGVKPGAEAGVAALGPKLGGIELFQHQNSFAVAVRSFVEAGDGVGIEAFGERNQSPPRHLCRDAGGLGGDFGLFQHLPGRKTVRGVVHGQLFLLFLEHRQLFAADGRVSCLWRIKGKTEATGLNPCALKGKLPPARAKI